jgi:hypothetical protein
MSKLYLHLPPTSFYLQQQNNLFSCGVPGVAFIASTVLQNLQNVQDLLDVT